MATYAAYRHVELDKVGCGKRSIMKPPGGDCHDIFGADFHGTPSHHRVLKPPGGGTSSLFATSSEDKPKSTTDVTSAVETNGLNGKSGNEYGFDDDDDLDQPNPETITNPDNPESGDVSIKSSLLSAEIKNLSALEAKRVRETLQTRNCVTGEGCQTTDHYVIRVHRQRDGNPVTGEGYDTTETQPTPPTRTRVPPGGYSSGLW